MKNKGFSFVELLVAVAILGIISLPIASSFALAAKIDAKARATYSASTAADDVLLVMTEIDNMSAVPDDVIAPDIPVLDEKTAYYIEKLLKIDHTSNADSDPSVNSVLYSFEYQGYDIDMVLTNLETFYRVDITLTYTVSGDSMQITRKGVLPIA